MTKQTGWIWTPEPRPASRPRPDRVPDAVAKHSQQVTASCVPTASSLRPGRTPATASRTGALSTVRRDAVVAGAEVEIENFRDAVEPIECVPRCGDVLELGTRWLGLLPLRAVLSCRAGRPAVAFHVAASRRHWEALRRSGAVVFGTAELAVLTCAVENDRANAASLQLWCGYKRHTPTWRLTQSVALDGVRCERACRPDAAPSGAGWGLHQLTIGRVLARLGAELVDVELYEAEAT